MGQGAADGGAERDRRRRADSRSCRQAGRLERRHRSRTRAPRHVRIAVARRGRHDPDSQADALAVVTAATPTSSACSPTPPRTRKPCPRTGFCASTTSSACTSSSSATSSALTRKAITPNCADTENTRRDTLHCNTAALLTPNLQQVAKSDVESDDEVCKLAGLVLALAVQVRSPDGSLSRGNLSAHATIRHCSRNRSRSTLRGYRASTSGCSVSSCTRSSRCVARPVSTSNKALAHAYGCAGHEQGPPC